MIWRFKSNKARVAAGMNRIIDYRADSTIWLWVTDHWAETELVADAPPPINHPPVAGDVTLNLDVTP